MQEFVSEKVDRPNRITVFTPTYNRAYIIEKLYHSLQKQKFVDFEWLVVDDGSSDDTELLFQRILNDKNLFAVRYIKTRNGGKHRAINRGVQEANGELFLIVDSDDHIVDDALEWIDKIEHSIPESEKQNFAGVCGLRNYSNGEQIGASFAGDYLDITTLEREKHGIKGDKAEAYYTDVLRQYPFPEFEGEKFMTECVVWDRIAADGLKLRFYNHASIICEYLPDGLTANNSSQIQRSPRGFALYLRQCQKYGKLSRLDMYDSYIGFCENLQDQYTFAQICDLLEKEPAVFRMMLLWMRVYRKLLSR